MMELYNYEPPNDLLKNRVILVTGATAGIGREVSRALITHGATVILHGRNANALETTYQEFRNLGPEPTIVQLDLEGAQDEECQNLAENLESKFDGIDGLLHNAGLLGARSPIEAYNPGVWRKVLQVNLNAPFILTRRLLPLLHQSEDASVLFTTSGVGSQGRAHWGAYCVSKFGIEGFTQTLADELKNSRIRVNCINPGATRTDMRAAAFPEENPEKLPLPETLTAPYLYLLGPDGRGIHGERIDAQR
jgi:NAD(P)-dependent dehydrogenase (short-subunit alcohol dehydrogenase family)